MRNAKTLWVGAACLLVAGFTVQTLSQTPRATQSSFRDVKRRMRESRRAREQKKKERERRPPLRRTNPEQRRREAQERAKKRREGLLREKAAINPTPAQWEVIKPLLEKIRQLREQPRSTAGLSLTSSISSSSRRADIRSRPVGMWQWTTPWEDKPASEWTEGQRTAQELIALVGGKNTTDEAFAQKTEALRQCRHKKAAEKKEKNIEKALAETRQQLRQALTTRQEAALVLMRWL